MKESASNSYPVERLHPEELKTANEQNLAEIDRRTTTRIFTIEETRVAPRAIIISYGFFSQDLPLAARDRVKPGTKVVVVQQSEALLSPVEGVYVLGENLKEGPKE